ncbi:MAG: protein kinase [Lentisphaeria bacterium]|nr:protein kinase [Lentisphaeria bacterium]
MKLQCTFCFTIISNVNPGTQCTCSNCGKLVAIPSDRFARGVVIGDFVIQNVIGHGGMATVYLARQLSMDRLVALKILSQQYARRKSFVQRFEKEAKAAARLNHPNMIQAIQVGREEDPNERGNSGPILYYAMEYVQGKTLAESLEQESTLDTVFALNVIQQCAEALHLAWTQEKLIHRDMKPDNVMLADDGYAKVMDLGIAIRIEESSQAEVSGTPTYMAPEQFKKEPLDCRTDIYSLGITLYQSIYGYLPFNGDTVKEIAKAHIFQDLVFPSDNIIKTPQRIQHLVSKMLAKSPMDRYQDYTSLLKEIVSIRERLAPDDVAIPNVHTVSFTKYRMQDLASPSEVYRKRVQKKSAVKKAKVSQVKRHQQIEVNQKKRPVILISSLLVVIAVLLAFIFYSLRREGTSRFVGDARVFINKATYKQITEDQQKQLSNALGQIGDILELYPKDPKRNDIITKSQLQDIRFELAKSYFNLKLGEINSRYKTSFQQAKDIQAKFDLTNLRYEELLVENEKLKESRQSVSEVSREVRQEKQEIKTAMDKLAVREERVAKREELQRVIAQKNMERWRYIIYWRIIDYLRLQQIKEFDTYLDRKDIKQVIGKKEYFLNLIELNSVRQKLIALNELSVSLEGIQVEQGRLVSVNKGQATIVRENSYIQDQISGSLFKLSPKVWYKILQSQAPKLAEDNPAAFFFWVGDFEEVFKHIDPNNKKLHIEYKKRIERCMASRLDELKGLYEVGYGKIALVRYKVFLKRYEKVPGFKQVIKPYEDLFKIKASSASSN